MIRFLKVFLLLLSAGSIAWAQPPANHPEFQERTPKFEMGPFAYWGGGIGNRSQYYFFAPGFQAGLVLTPVLHAGILSGRFELAANIQPFWQAYTPAPHMERRTCIDPDGNKVSCTVPVGGGTFTGASITPVIFRWDFANHSKRIKPWFQGAGGLIYTTHKFPPDVMVPHGLPGGTSVWNFSPQGGFGFHFFTRPNRSVDLAVNAVHISSSSLGDKNPGVNASYQVQVGYTFWR